MPNRINYQQQMEGVLRALDEAGQRPRLLLHACCAPCSSATRMQCRSASLRQSIQPGSAAFFPQLME